MVKIKIKKNKKVDNQVKETIAEENVVVLPPMRMSDDPTPKQRMFGLKTYQADSMRLLSEERTGTKPTVMFLYEETGYTSLKCHCKAVKWINRQRVLVFAARGINHRHRHLMEDLKKLMPHHKSDSKMERSKNLYVVNEISEMKNCNKCVLFEGRKMRDLYLWISNIPNGPSAKFLVENIYTMGELKMTGNCLKGSRPLLSFDPQFTKDAHYNLLKELLTQIFGVPKHHPKSQPFFDHVYTFMILDNRIWFRNYQILSEDGALAEIGPRFVLNPVKIFSGSFGGSTLWENPRYVSPAKLRQAFSKKAAHKYERRIEKKVMNEATKPETGYPDIEGPDFFKGDPMEKAEDVLMEEAIKLEAENETHTETKTVVIKKKSKSKPDMAIRRKQLKAKSKAISDQIKKRKQFKKKRPVK